MDDKLKTTLHKIKLLSEQNEEFANEMRKMFGKTSSAQVVNGDGKIDEIYEYCLEKVISKQAADFYETFPISEIKDQLIEDFKRMERFRREDNFGDFCLAIYQQIEAITGNLCNNDVLKDITNAMWLESNYVDMSGSQTLPNVKRWEKKVTIAQFVYPGKDKEGKELYKQKVKNELSQNSAKDQIRVVLYFVGFNTILSQNNRSVYDNFLRSLTDIYLCRNSNHRGENFSEIGKQNYENIAKFKSYYFYKYIGVLTQFVDYIKKGYELLPVLNDYSRQFIINDNNKGNLPEESAAKEAIDDGKKNKGDNKAGQEILAEITSKLPSACFIKYGEESTQLPPNLFPKVRDKKDGDFIKILVSGHNIKDILLD